MTKRMTVIEPSGSYWSETLTEVPSLERLQGIVGGLIERVPLFDTYEGQPCVVYVNEEGKLLGLTYNGRATREWKKAVGREFGDRLVGSVVIIEGFPDA